MGHVWIYIIHPHRRCGVALKRYEENAKSHFAFSFEPEYMDVFWRI